MKAKENDFVICKWKKENGGEYDIAIVLQSVGKCFTAKKFYRIRGVEVEIITDCGDMINHNDWRYSMNWRKMTIKEKAKFLSIIVREKHKII